MTLYPRPQLTLMLLLVVVAGTGLAISHWRRAHPDLAERLEQLDRAPAKSASPSRAPRVATADAAPSHRHPQGPGSEKRTAPGGEPLDLNRASAAELEALPGVGASLARRIVDARERDGRFGSVDDLRRVRGVSRGRLDRLRPLLDVTP